jgi:hypothetical protein
MKFVIPVKIVLNDTAICNTYNAELKQPFTSGQGSDASEDEKATALFLATPFYNPLGTTEMGTLVPLLAQDFLSTSREGSFAQIRECFTRDVVRGSIERPQRVTTSGGTENTHGRNDLRSQIFVN